MIMASRRDARRAPCHGLFRALAFRALAAAALLLAPAGLSGQAADGGADGARPLVGDRPDFTESAVVVSRLQVEAGYTFEDVGSADVHTVGELLVRVPTARRLEIRLGVPSWIDERRAGGRPDAGVSGFEDATVGLKLGLRDPVARGGGPAVAVLAGTTLPTGDDFGSDGLRPEARLAAGLDVSDRLSLGANAGVASSTEGAGDRYAELSGSLSLALGLTERLGGFLEAYGLVPTDDAPASSSVVNGGLTWLVDPDLQLDARLGAGLSGPVPDLIFGTGVVWRP